MSTKEEKNENSDSKGSDRSDLDWVHNKLEWTDFLKTLNKSKKQIAWRTCKEEDASRIVFVIIGQFVELFHQDAVFFKNKFALELKPGDAASTGFLLSKLDFYKNTLQKEGFAYTTLV